jgi:hypothetical protein
MGLNMAGYLISIDQVASSSRLESSDRVNLLPTDYTDYTDYFQVWPVIQGGGFIEGCGFVDVLL